MAVAGVLMVWTVMIVTAQGGSQITGMVIRVMMMGAEGTQEVGTPIGRKGAPAMNGGALPHKGKSWLFLIFIRVLSQTLQNYNWMMVWSRRCRT